MAVPVHDNGDGSNVEPIAIVGMGCRWPGGVSTPSDLWTFLEAGESGYGDFPQDRFSLPGFYHKDQQRPGSFHTKGAYLLKEDPRLFDHSFFGISPMEARTMDPSQRKLLEVSFEAFENAGQTLEKLRGTKTGVYVGNFGSDHQNMQFRDPDFPLPTMLTGGDSGILSSRIHYIFDLRGPSMTLNTACSSSLYALHLAVSGIRNGDCEAAIVAGSNVILDPGLHLFGSKLGTLSPTSCSHSLDASADGYARAEGFGALYVMPLDKALTEGYPLRAIIRGSAIGANGRSNGISHPSSQGQEAVIRHAYNNAGNLGLAHTAYFECHSTGTPVGDPLEISAIGNVFADYCNEEPLLIGALKPNLGHSESASGIAAIMKVVLALEKGRIPPTIGISRLNPKIDFVKSRTRVVTRMVQWPRHKSRRAGVSAFGYGGSNAHVILDHPSTLVSHLAANLAADHGDVCSKRISNPKNVAQLPNSSHRQGSTLLVFSANDDQALRRNVEAIMSVRHQHLPLDLAYTLDARRSRFSHRTFTIATPDAIFAPDILEGLPIDKIFNGGSPTINLVFTGQGAQWPNMSRRLFAQCETFRNSIVELDKTIAALSNKPLWQIANVINDIEFAGRIHEPIKSQTVCTAIQVALVDLLASFNIRPSFVTGHSSGEIAAAYASGYISRAQAVVVAYMRGLVISMNEEPGSMLAVGLGQHDAQRYADRFSTQVQVACINSPKSVTLAGDAVAMSAIFDQLREDEVFCRPLKTGGNAYHSHHMLKLGVEYERLINSALHELQINPVFQCPAEVAAESPLWVSTTVSPLGNVILDHGFAAYWRRNLESPVRFSEAIEHIHRHMGDSRYLFVEIGPHPALRGPVKQIIEQVENQDSNRPSHLATLERGKDDVESIFAMAGKLFMKDAPIDITAVNTSMVGPHPRKPKYCLGLPNYAYTYGPVLYEEPRINKEWRQRKFAHHDLLGTRLTTSSFTHPSWRNILRLKDVPWMADHRFNDRIIFPAAGYLSMAMEAVSQARDFTNAESPPQGFQFRRVRFDSVLEIPSDDTGIEIILNMRTESSHGTPSRPYWYEFTITSLEPNTSTWVDHCNGLVKVEESSAKQHTYDIPSPNKRKRPVEIDASYDRFRRLGLNYGEQFRCLSDLHTSNGGCIANVLPAHQPIAMTNESLYTLHPAHIDACIQLAIIAAYESSSHYPHTAHIPVFADGVTVWKAAPFTRSSCGKAYASGNLKGDRSLYSSITLCDPAEKILMSVDNLKCSTYTAADALTENIIGRTATPFMRLVYKPNIDQTSDASLREMFPMPQLEQDSSSKFHRLERLFAYMAVWINISYSHSNVQAPTSDLQQYWNWISRCVAELSKGELKYGDEALAASPELLLHEIRAIFDGMRSQPEAILGLRIFENFAAILANDITGLQLAMDDDMLTQLYTSGFGYESAYVQLENALDLLAHKNPRMRILEVGAGTGGATKRILELLGGRNVARRYKDYTFTDVTTSFLNAAKERFADYSSIKYATFSIDQDPREQGFGEEYDLVVASMVMHVTDSISKAIWNVRRLLKPGGKLLLIEITREFNALRFVLGTLPGYWKGSFDDRLDSPFASVSRWSQDLSQNGFSGADMVLDAAISNVILSTAIDRHSKPEAHLSSQHDLWLLSSAEPCSLAKRVEILTRKAGLQPRHLTMSDVAQLREAKRIISFIGVQHLETTMSELLFSALQAMVEDAEAILWLSRSTGPSCATLTGAIPSGILRTVTRESPGLEILHCCFDELMDNESCAQQVVTHMHELSGASANKETEVFVAGSNIPTVGRIIPADDLNLRFRAQEASRLNGEVISLKELPPVKLTFGQPGLLSTLHFIEDSSMHNPLDVDWVELRSEVIDLNMRDLAVATGQFDSEYLSTQCCGVITRAGANVRSFKVGDRVFGLAPGNFGNFVRTRASALLLADPKATSEELASLPVSYMTAIYALYHLARLKPGETILIQSAASGLGLAALRIAMHVGADVYVTVGTSSKADMLANELGIPRSHIYPSRDVSTWSNLRRDTGGIDVILCSTSGEHLQESWRCIAPLGRFIEVGRVDVLHRGSIPLEVFERNATFSSFDLTLLHEQKPTLITELMNEMMALYKQGVVRPIDRITKFNVSEIEKAMMYMSKGTHIGKIVIMYDNPDSEVQVVPSIPRAKFDPAAAYILVGGLHSGVTKTIGTWMASRGAKNLFYLSRSGASDTDTVDTAASAEVRHTSLRCDVTDRKEVDTVVQYIGNQMPIKGILHGAMVLKDLSFKDLSFETFQEGLAPKVQGAINFHEATLTQPLEFFTMTSSVIGLIGTATQSSYVAANCFLDSFARHRHSMGLPAQALSLGVITDVGHVSRFSAAQLSTPRNGIYGTSEAELLELLDTAFTAPQNICEKFDRSAGAHLILGLDPARIYELDKETLGSNFLWATDPQFGQIMQTIESHHDVARSSSTDSSVPHPIATIEAATTLARQISRNFSTDPEDARSLYSLVDSLITARVARLLFLSTEEMDEAKEIAAYGIDSMISAELRSWLLSNFGLSVGFAELIRGTTIGGLTTQAVSRLLAKYARDEVSGT